MSEQQEEMPTLEGNLAGLPATILQLLNTPVPNHLPPPITPIVNLFKQKGKIDRIIINMIDNFGLFEITYYKPQFLISTADALLLLSTQNPYTLGMFHQRIKLNKIVYRMICFCYQCITPAQVACSV